MILELCKSDVEFFEFKMKIYVLDFDFDDT